MRKSIFKKAGLIALMCCCGTAVVISCKKASAPVNETSVASVEAKNTLAVSEINTSTQAETGFESGAGPYTACDYVSPSFAQVMTPNLGAMYGTKVMKFSWQQSTWDNPVPNTSQNLICGNYSNRSRKGVEACSGLKFAKDGWIGAGLLIPSGFPTNRHTIVAQGFNYGGCGSWGWILYLEGNDLRLSYRANCNASGYADVLIASNIQRDVWKPIILQWRVSKTNHGKIVVWYGNDASSQSTPTYQASNINLGYGDANEWTTDDKFVNNSKWVVKFGIYASDCCEHVGDGGSRTLYYDNVGEWVDDNATNNGFDKVNPNN